MMEKNPRQTGLARVSQGKGHHRRDRPISKETRPSKEPPTPSSAVGMDQTPSSAVSMDPSMHRAQRMGPLIDTLSVNHFCKFLLVGRRDHDPIMAFFLPFQHLPTRIELRDVLGGLIDGTCGKQGQRASDFYIDSMLGELIACLAEGH